MDFLNTTTTPEEEETDQVLYAISVLLLLLVLGGGFAANRLLSRLHGLGYWIFVRNAGYVICMLMFVLACVFDVMAFWVEGAWYHAFGPLAELLFCVMFTLPSGRGSIVWYALGIPHERVIIFHRVMGLLLPIVIGMHGFGYYADHDWDSALFSFEKYGEVRPLAGLFVFIAVILIVPPAKPEVKAKRFELFFFSHWLLIPIIIVFAIVHTSYSILYFAPGIVMHTVNAVFCWCRPLGVVVSEDITPGGSHAKIVIRAEKLGEVGPGTYVYLSGDNVVRHPFSVVDCKDKCVTLGIKNMGPGTSTERIIQKLSPGASVRVSGPLGKPSVAAEQYEKVLLMGGGIGATPLLGTATWLARKKVKNVDVHLHWVVREAALPKLFLSELVDLNATIGMRTTLYYTGKENSAEQLSQLPPPSVEVVRSRPDYDRILGECCKSAGLSAPLASSPVAVMVCGPEPMMESICKTVTSKTWGNTRFDVHTEVFVM